MSDQLSACRVRPQACTAIVDPVCACDGQIYSNECEANVAGQDASDGGGCTPPPGTFACGRRFCTRGSQFCEAMLGGAVGSAGSYGCQPLPAACGTAPGCACLSGTACGNCRMSAAGDLMTSCLFP